MHGLMAGSRKMAGQEEISKIPLSLMLVVQNALSQAWHILLAEVASGQFSICSTHEDVITERLYMIMGDLYSSETEKVQGFALFETPVREGNLRNAKGDRLDCQPDLTFRPLKGQVATKSHVMAGIFVECKPIDSEHRIGSTYCKKGISRFVQGEYAWAVDRAIMLAYVRNICQLPDGLSYVLEQEPAKTVYKLIEKLALLVETSQGEVVYCTVHQRTLQDAPIMLHHLWLNTDEPCEPSKCRT